MEGFLSTLPPYVHHYLDRYPPTDVFNVLRELICFAVLYSDDRNRMRQATQRFVQRRNPQHNTFEYRYYENDSEHELDSFKEHDFQEDLKSVSTLPEFYAQRPVEAPVQTKESEQPKKIMSGWIPLEDNKNTFRKLERAKSQIIPDLRPYLEQDHTRMITSGTPSATATNKRHSMINIKTSSSSLTNSPHIKAAASSKLVARSVSASPIPETPKKPLSRSQSIQDTSGKGVPKMAVSSSTGTMTPTRTSSVQLKQPRINAATRARAEHARLQQEELERKKIETPTVSPITQRINQRASSGIDWDAIKKERRKTLSIFDNSEEFF